mmetsp:Transcript_10248/g.20586  ORF Transcript_10248/g.20586 Transcript_10248/m.20586 type:complete len:265 (+) Transcript_10248:89-883(+)|eukprot:scaffold51_cov152-Skeletonema_marinoi.AAC.3
MSNKRPDRTTMEGMIWNANHVLDKALDPKTPGIPRGMIKNCKGVILLSMAEAGFIFSGTVGSGVIIAHNEDNSWSPPSALSVGGIGWGLVAGKEVKDVIICVMERGNVDTLSAETQVKIGGQLSATLGPVGREAETSLNFNGTSEIRGTYAYTWSKGVFGGISMETAVLKVRPKENARFYGKESVSSKEILENTLAAPKDMGVEDLHYKLDLLSKGKALVLTPAQVERKSSMRNLADEAGVLAKSVQTDVMVVDADEEAKKEVA